MSVVTRAHSRPRRSPELRYLIGGVAGALVASALGYLLHHLPPLEDHPVQGVLAAVFAAAASAVAVGAVVGRPGRYELPAVVVASAGKPGARPLERHDVDFCAALHGEALPHGFFVALGPRFLRSYYATFLESPYAVGLIATISGQPVGALVGILDPRAHARWLVRRRGAALALRAGAAMAVHPGAALRFARTRVTRYVRTWRRHRRAAGAIGTCAAAEAPAVLSHVSVLPGARGLAAGRVLVEAFEDAASAHGARRAILTTIEGPGGAGGFYERLGWQWSATHVTADGARVEEWTRDLDAAGAP